MLSPRDTATFACTTPQSQGGIIDRLEREKQANGNRRPTPDSVVDLEALALHAVCEVYTKNEGIHASGEEAEVAKAKAALHGAQSSWLAAMNCLPAVYLSELKHRARNDQHTDAWEWGRSRPAEVRACMKAARPIELRQVCVMAPSARRVTALVARKALDDSHEVKLARFKKERVREGRRHQKAMQELNAREEEYQSTRQATGAPPASPTAAAAPGAAAPGAAAPAAAAPAAPAPAATAQAAAAPAAAAQAKGRPQRKRPADIASEPARPRNAPARRGSSRATSLQQIGAAEAAVAEAQPRGQKRKAASDGERAPQRNSDDDT